MLIKKSEVEATLSIIPEQPGCYTYRNEEGAVIYVGKAKNLKRRIASYFQKNIEDRKTRALLRHFSTLEYIVVATEHDALLLEYNLIKQYLPIYNIMLKEGNHYPHICITKEEFPKVFITFKVIRDGSEYYGPYPNRTMAWTLIRLFRQIYKFRTCNLKLTSESIQMRKHRVCLKYHIDRCKAPCVGKQSKREYREHINQAKEILNGNIKEVKRLLQERMAEAAEQLEYEKALDYKQTIEALEGYQAKSTIVSQVIDNALVVTARSDLDSFYLNYLILHNGAIIAGRTQEYKKGVEESNADLIASIVMELLESPMGRKTKEIILEEPLEYAHWKDITITIPQRGDRRKVLDLSRKNVEQYIEDKQKRAEKMNPEQRNTQILRELMTAVGLPKLPYHVETFDNSNLQGSNPVAACVVFKGGKPDKKSYRHYHIREVEGPDDYASMYEVVHRRYSKIVEEKGDLPDLIITDGGKGQMGVVKKALEEVGVEIPVMGLAKDEKHNTNQILYGEPPVVVGIMQRSQVFHLLERIQNEVHRFAIKFHRDQRSKAMVRSELDEIPGIGPVNQRKLLQQFKSVKRIKEASLEALQGAIGAVKGETVFNHFREKRANEGSDTAR